MRRACATVVCAMAMSAFGAAQGQAPLHDPQYSDADIAYGATLYKAQCVTCHGVQGDAIGGVNLRSGTFRNAVIDRDLDRFIRAGSPAGMPPFRLDNAEMAGIIAYLRNMNYFDSAAVKTGDAARGRAIFDGKGGCTACHRAGLSGSRVEEGRHDRQRPAAERGHLHPAAHRRSRASPLAAQGRPSRVLRLHDVA